MVTVEEHDDFVVLSAPAMAPTVDNAPPTPPAPAAPPTAHADDVPAGSASEPSPVRPPVGRTAPVASQTEARTGVSVAWLFLIPVALAIFCVGVDIGSALEAHATSSAERERRSADGGHTLAAGLSAEAEAEVSTRASSLAPTCGPHAEDAAAADAWIGLEPLERELTATRARAQAAEREAHELRAQLEQLRARSSALVAHLNYTYAVSAKWESIARAGIAAHNRWKARELQRKMLWRQAQMRDAARARAAGVQQQLARGGRGRGKAGSAKAKKVAADARCAERECPPAPKQQ